MRCMSPLLASLLISGCAGHDWESVHYDSLVRADSAVKSVIMGDWTGDGADEVIVLSERGNVQVVDLDGTEQASFRVSRSAEALLLAWGEDGPVLITTDSEADELTTWDATGEALWSVDRVATTTLKVHDLDEDGLDEILYAQTRVGHGEWGLLVRDLDGEVIGRDPSCTVGEPMVLPASSERGPLVLCLFHRTGVASVVSGLNGNVPDENWTVWGDSFEWYRGVHLLDDGEGGSVLLEEFAHLRAFTPEATEIWNGSIAIFEGSKDHHQIRVADTNGDEREEWIYANGQHIVTRAADGTLLDERDHDPALMEGPDGWMAVRPTFEGLASDDARRRLVFVLGKEVLTQCY